MARAGGGEALLSAGDDRGGNPGAEEPGFRALAAYPPVGTVGRRRFQPAAVS